MKHRIYRILFIALSLIFVAPAYSKSDCPKGFRCPQQEQDEPPPPSRSPEQEDQSTRPDENGCVQWRKVCKCQWREVNICGAGH